MNHGVVAILETTGEEVVVEEAAAGLRGMKAENAVEIGKLNSATAFATRGAENATENGIGIGTGRENGAIPTARGAPP